MSNDKAVVFASPNTVGDILKTNMTLLQEAAPRHMTVDRLLRIAVTLVRQTPRLQQCTLPSVLSGVMRSAQTGLDLDPFLGEAYLVPFKNGRLTRQAGRDVYEAQWIAGYQGMLKLSRQSGLVKTIEARAVRAGDTFDYEYGTGRFIKHKPGLERGEITHVYCIVDQVNEGITFTVMSKADVDKRRARSRAKDDGPWVTDYEPMALKTVTRDHYRWMPKSTELARVITFDERSELGLPIGQPDHELLRGMEGVADLIGTDSDEEMERGGDALDKMVEEARVEQVSVVTAPAPSIAERVRDLGDPAFTPPSTPTAPALSLVEEETPQAETTAAATPTVEQVVETMRRKAQAAHVYSSIDNKVRIFPHWAEKLWIASGAYTVEELQQAGIPLDTFYALCDEAAKSKP